VHRFKLVDTGKIQFEEKSAKPMTIEGDRKNRKFRKQEPVCLTMSNNGHRLKCQHPKQDIMLQEIYLLSGDEKINNEGAIKT
jgi:hypothetical protein